METKEGEEVQQTPSITTTTTTAAGEPEAAAQTVDSSKEGEEVKKPADDGETESPVRKPNPRLRLGANPGAIIRIRR